MNLIVSADENWGIGRAGELLAPIPADFRWFKQHTLGKTVVLGQLTLDTFPGGKPLPGRENIILSDDPAFTAEGAIIVRSLPELLRLLAGYESDSVYIIGGASIYKLLLPWCRHAWVTRIRTGFDADRFFPDLDQEPGWRLVETGAEQEHDGLRFCFCHYVNSAPLALDAGV